jgi:3',5'-cyclic AMP phosphodiesterase CpdA
MSLLATLFLSLSLAACSGDDTTSLDGDTGLDGDEVLDGDAEPDGDGDSEADGDPETDGDSEEPVRAVYTGLQRRLVPTLDAYNSPCFEDDSPAECDNPGLSSLDLSAYEAAGFGFWTDEPGNDFILNEELDFPRGELGERRSLLRWAQLSDVHVTDEESPLRLGFFDTRSVPGGLRPMDMYSEVVLDAAVRTINALNDLAPLDVVLVTGDLIDMSQRNELANALAILGGGAVDPDSGADDDPVPGPGNDPQDPFDAVGLDIPWIITPGNHDMMLLGSFPVTDNAKLSAVGSSATTGTRDGQTYEVISGEIAADPQRAILSHTDLIEAVYDAPGLPEGHGFTPASLPNDRAYYSYDPSPDSPVRFIVLDFAYRIGGPVGKGGTGPYDDGVLDKAQYEDFLLPELARAEEDKKLVIVVSHQPSWVLQDDNLPDDYVTVTQFRATLSEAHILLHIAGHSHENRLSFWYGSELGAHAEIQVSSLIDWPQQFRLFELVDNGNGTLSIFTAVVDHQDAPGSLSEDSRRRALIDRQSGWGEGFEGEDGDRNVEIVLAIPAGFEQAVSDAPGAELAATGVWSAPLE